MPSPAPLQPLGAARQNCGGGKNKDKQVMTVLQSTHDNCTGMIAAVLAARARHIEQGDNAMQHPLQAKLVRVLLPQR